MTTILFKCYFTCF